ncbi:MAG: response regulator [Halobacteriovoraceae bacterium]|nr:response regulator [Halobacteriovoraceae bacterium]
MLKKRNLFLIDDVEDLVEMIEDQLDEYFNVKAFTKVGPALKYLKEHSDELDIILSDFKMPEKNGIEILEEVMALNPNTTRIILTGYADEDIIKNSSHVYHKVMDKNEYIGPKDFLEMVEKLEEKFLK